MRTSFEPGAPAAADVIPLSIPVLRGNEGRYLQECIDAGWVSSVGPFVDRFEESVAAYVGAEAAHAVAVVNGTSALHLALLVCGIEPEDEVLVSDLTFIASVNPIRYAGAWPVFIGAEADYWQMDPVLVSRFLKERCERRGEAIFNKRTNRRVRALVVVHVLGHPVDLAAMRALADEYGLLLIEDCAESIGAEYRGRRVGTAGDASIFSFNGNKIITCGGGGVLLTADAARAERARYLSTQAKDDPLEYEHASIGYNYRLTNLQAAVGMAQLEQLDGFISHRRRVAERYRAAFADLDGVTFMPEAPWAKANFWLSTILVDEARFGMNSRALLKALAAQRIQARPLWQPMHQSQAHTGCEAFGCEISAALHRQALSLPSSANLTHEDQDRVITAIRQAALQDA